MERESDLKLLFWVISSHGGTCNSRRIVFDSEWRKIWLEADLFSRFSPEICPFMSDRHRLFYVNACRSDEKEEEQLNGGCGGGDDEEDDDHEPLFRAEVGSRIVVSVAEENQFALRNTVKGSLAIVALRKTIRKYGDAPPIDDILRKTNKELQKLIGMAVDPEKGLQCIPDPKSKFKHFAQRIVPEGQLESRDVYFKAKNNEENI